MYNRLYVNDLSSLVCNICVPAMGTSTQATVIINKPLIFNYCMLIWAVLWIRIKIIRRIRSLVFTEKLTWESKKVFRLVLGLCRIRIRVSTILDLDPDYLTLDPQHGIRVTILLKRSPLTTFVATRFDFLSLIFQFCFTLTRLFMGSSPLVPLLCGSI